jgi:hypothetical protein
MKKRKSTRLVLRKSTIQHLGLNAQRKLKGGSDVPIEEGGTLDISQCICPTVGITCNGSAKICCA